jgi:hypothetical protein
MRLAAWLLFILLAGAAQAQPAPTESVTVTGARSRQVLQHFVETFAAPARLTGKLARWEDGVCPITVGLKPAFTGFISARVMAVAAQVRAPVNTQHGCKPNIEIVFTTAPQGLLDNVRKKQATYLGYADNSDQLDALARVTRPIQAWYTTATRDLRGNVHVDGSRIAGLGMPVEIPCENCPNGKMTFYGISAGTVTGSRLGDGMRSSLYHVIIVADPAKLKDHEIGALADYIALLALGQVSGLDGCQTLPSIVNMLAPGCETQSRSLTAGDLGYLRGLYSMGPGRNLRGQEDAIAFAMQRQLDGK